MTKSEIYYLAGKCLVIDEKQEFKEKFIKLCKNNSIDWLQLVAICSDNLILLAIYLKFRSNGILEYLPEEINEHLSEIYELNKLRNNEILRQIKAVTSILNENGIIPLYLKGAGNLLDDVYSDVGERIMGDIDLLVSEKEFIPSVILMLDNGYLSTDNSTDINIRKHKHYSRIYHPDFIVDIEIHRTPVEHMNLSWFNSEIVNIEKRTTKTLDGCYVESDKHKIIHNFIHDHLEHQMIGNYGKIPLRDIYDLYLFSKRFSLIDSISQIQHKKKAVAYFTFAQYVFGAVDENFPKQNFDSMILRKRHELHLNSSIFVRVYPKLHHRYVRFKQGYFVLFIRVFYSREARQRVIKKCLTIAHKG